MRIMAAITIDESDTCIKWFSEDGMSTRVVVKKIKDKRDFIFPIYSCMNNVI